MSREIPQPCPGFLSIDHAAQWSDVSVKTIKRWIRKGLPCYQEGPRTKVLLRPSDMEAFLTRRQVPKSNLEDMVDTVMSELQG